MCCVMLSPMWQVRVVIYISPSSQTKTAPSTLRHWQIQWNRKSKGSQKIYELTGQKFESGENLVLWKTSVIPGRTSFYLWNYHFLRFRKVKVYICLCTYIYIYIHGSSAHTTASSKSPGISSRGGSSKIWKRAWSHGDVRSLLILKKRQEYKWYNRNIVFLSWYNMI